MDRGRGRTPHSRGRNPPKQWSPRSYDQSKLPHNPVVGDGSSASKSYPAKDERKSYQQISGGSFLQSPDVQSDLGEHLRSRNPPLGQKTEEIENPSDKTEKTESPALVHPYDICRPKEFTSVVLKPSLLERNRERRKETKRNTDTTSKIVLRPGMILLKGYITLSNQVRIVERCRQLGVGPGGFYQPGYSDGTKLHLKMMCLGKNWDPQTRQYGDHRPFDGAKPPSIPVEFLQITENAIKDSHVLLKRRNPEKILPWMSPDICLVNSYTRDGNLGLHQDKDESEESLRQGLPVVSFSIGDSADFLYGDERNVDKAQKVVLESGDVLIFGGQSRHIFHGVNAIHPNTAPKILMDDTNLRPGRLNLTLRQY
ncbi:hypothetical protein K1719_009197 [Acacia pycnantha]|nr:hypothetical protein K1719_009197 [Acacia pycnantha]